MYLRARNSTLPRSLMTAWNQETYEDRDSFLRDIYLNHYEAETPLGAAVRELHQKGVLGTLRQRQFYSWYRWLKRWGVAPGPILAAWRSHRTLL